ncbi:hypothetical protein [Kibdelosporangium phytohabitans]|uniref:Gram-positive cocci surface proteins LPxTG domain-containing protein n=1 Tax=Kibdelosporangium phytohabitans TaxID=860235 RepID=A0A0N9IBU7_9PSEU|nr:hypothetical protein [Kibdelosporangium phytohabitans]ALG13737.1 hypothetical protein AOZ06_48875 [Kibdelosporangium phytohabitans]MBE1465630.1 ABC-type uncharacterized transport system permease subunit [Kibdelosporangium phytohabitans]
MTFVALFMVASAGAAFAQDTAQAMPANVGGPVGIGVAAVGLTGVVLGFLRFIRKSSKDARVTTPVEAPSAPVVPIAVVVAEPDVAPQPAPTA